MSRWPRPAGRLRLGSGRQGEPPSVCQTPGLCWGDRPGFCDEQVPARAPLRLSSGPQASESRPTMGDRWGCGLCAVRGPKGKPRRRMWPRHARPRVLIRLLHGLPVPGEGHRCLRPRGAHRPAPASRPTRGGHSLRPEPGAPSPGPASHGSCRAGFAVRPAGSRSPGRPLPLQGPRCETWEEE